MENRTVTKRVVFSDQIGNRDRRSMNIIIACLGDEQLMFRFNGESIPGIAQVASIGGKKQGKWSYNEWLVDLAEGVDALVWWQDWEKGLYITAQTWGEAIDFVKRLRPEAKLQSKTIERFIRAELFKAANRLDRAEEASTADPAIAFKELLNAQNELAAAQAEHSEVEKEREKLATEIQETIDARREAKEARREAEAKKVRVQKAKSAMKSGASLADLQELLGS